MALVDIVVPCYRYGKFLPDCIESIISQSVRDVRILIIDDASPDDSAVIARQVATWHRAIEVVVHTVNQGHIATYNEGIEWASSPYFLLLSADDLLAPGAIERAIALMEAQADVVLTYGKCVELKVGQSIPRVIDPSGEPFWHVRAGSDFVRENCSVMWNPVPTATAIVRTAVQKRVGGYRAELPHTGDMEMWLRLAAHGSVAVTSFVQGFYRVHGANMSAAFYRSVVADYLQREAAFDSFFANDGARLPDSAALHRQAIRRLGEAAYWTGIAQCCRRKIKTGRNLLNFAWRVNPDTRLLPPMGCLLRMNRPDLKVLQVFSALFSRGPNH